MHAIATWWLSSCNESHCFSASLNGWSKALCTALLQLRHAGKSYCWEKQKRNRSHFNSPWSCIVSLTSVKQVIADDSAESCDVKAPSPHSSAARNPADFHGISEWPKKCSLTPSCTYSPWWKIPHPLWRIWGRTPAWSTGP